MKTSENNRQNNENGAKTIDKTMKKQANTIATPLGKGTNTNNRKQRKPIEKNVKNKANAIDKTWKSTKETS